MNATYPLANYSQIANLCSIRKSYAFCSQIISPFFIHIILGHFLCSSGLKAHSPCSLITHNVGILLVQISRTCKRASHLICELDPTPNKMLVQVSQIQWRAKVLYIFSRFFFHGPPGGVGAILVTSSKSGPLDKKNWEKMCKTFARHCNWS